MDINKNYVSNNNSYENNSPKYIVIHNTDNFEKKADAKAHAKAQRDGHLQGMSAHYFVDDSGVYQAMPHSCGAWHVGVNYGGKLFGTVSNRNSIGIEMCVNTGYNYEKAFQNTVTLTKQLMKELNLNADHVVSHYDVCGKNCPSQIRVKGDWARFKKLIGAADENIKGVVINNSNVEAISKVVYGEAGVIQSRNGFLGVAQCIYDMLESGQFGKTVTEVMERNFSAYGSKSTSDEARQAVHDVFCKGVKRFADAQIFQFRSLKYSDGAGNMDKQKCASLLEKYEYLGKDIRNDTWGHLYFGRKLAEEEQEVTPINKQIKVQCGAYEDKKNAQLQVERLQTANFASIIKKEDGMHKVQCGAFDILANAEKLAYELEKAGFDAIIK